MLLLLICAALAAVLWCVWCLCRAAATQDEGLFPEFDSWREEQSTRRDDLTVQP